MKETPTQEEIARFEASQRGRQVKRFGDIVIRTENFYLYENYRFNFCTARCVRVDPQCDIRSRKTFNAKCWTGGLFPDLRDYDSEIFVLVD